MLNRWLFVVVLPVVFLTCPLNAADPLAPKISQLHVDQKIPEDLQVNLFSSEGVHFVLVLTAQPGQTIVGVDEEASKLISATDDKGTDLTENSTEKWLSEFFSKISKKRTKIAIPITIGTLPAPEATSIQFKADIVLNCGSKEKTEKIKPFDLAKGSSSKFGNHTLDIQLGTNRVGGAESKSPQITVTMNGNGAWVKSIDFVDEKGKAIKTSSEGSSSSNVTMIKEYTLDTEATSIGAKVVYYENLEAVTRSIDMKVGLGLP